MREAISRLLGQPKLPNTADAYSNEYVPRFRELALLCKTNDFRKLDQALFSYGALGKKYFGGIRRLAIASAGTGVAVQRR